MKALKRSSLMFVCLLVMLAIYVLPTRAAEETTDVVLTVEYGQTEARSMLEYINLFRTGKDVDGQKPEYWDSSDTQLIQAEGLKVLQYDYDLEAMAMQRAAEIAFYFAHTRPDGTHCFSYEFESGVYFSSQGENIALGYQNALAVFRGFREDTDPYILQGHRRNMLNSGYNCVGLGYAVVNGIQCWVQEFGYRYGSSFGETTPALDGSKEVTVRLINDYIDVQSIHSTRSTITVEAEKRRKLPEITAKIRYTESYWAWSVFSVSPTVQWETMDKNVATVNTTKVQGVFEGSTTIEAKVWGETLKSVITVNTILSQPEDVCQVIGEDATFSITTSGSDLSYRWQYSADNGNSWQNVSEDNEGWNTPRLSVKVKESLNGYLYRCAVTHTSGKEAYSKGAQLKVRIHLLTQPLSKNGYEGDSVKFAVQATGVGLNYKWEFSKNGGKKWNTWSSGAKSIGVLINEARNNYQFRCIISDVNGQSLTSEVAALTVKYLISTQPVSISGYVGETLPLSIQAVGEGTLNYKWEFSKDKGKTWETWSTGANALKVRIIAGRNNYRFRCVVSDSKGHQQISDVVVLKVKPSIMSQPKAKSVAVGAKAKFSVTASGSKLKYTWQFSKDGGKNWEKWSSGDSITVVGKESRNNYLFRCLIKDANGVTIVSSEVKLTVK